MAVRVSLHYGVSRPLRRRAGCAQRPPQPEDHARCRRVLGVRFVSIGSSCGHTDNGRDCSSATSGTVHCAVQEHKHARRKRATLARIHVHMRGFSACAFALTSFTGFWRRYCGCVAEAGSSPSLHSIKLTLASRQQCVIICCFQTDLQASAGTSDAAVAMQVRQVHMHATASFELSHICI